MFNYKLSHILC